MRVRNISETFRISEPDTTGLIPKCVVEINILYDENGKPSLNYVTEEVERNPSVREAHWRAADLRPVFPDTIEKVIRYLKDFCER